LVAALFVLIGSVAALLLATAGTTWSLSAGDSPSGSLVLIWTAVALFVSSCLAAAVVARRTMHGRLRATSRVHQQVERLTVADRARAGTLAEIATSVGDARAELEERMSDLERAVRDVEHRLVGRIADTSRRLDRIGSGTSAVKPFGTLSDRRPRHIFVLGTGRCGTATFSAACAHFDNFTTTHESRSHLLGPTRFDYPDHHVEVDNRLSWFLGELDRRFDDDETFYFHLTRSSDEVIQSFARRWNSGFRSSIGRAFGYGIVISGQERPAEEVESVLRFYVDTVTSNIDAFLHGRNGMNVELENIEEQFDEFANRIGATGDFRDAHRELAIRHNASRETEPPLGVDERRPDGASDAAGRSTAVEYKRAT